MREDARRFGITTGVSLAVHAAIAAFVILLSARAPIGARDPDGEIFVELEPSELREEVASVEASAHDAQPEPPRESDARAEPARSAPRAAIARRDDRAAIEPEPLASESTASEPLRELEPLPEPIAPTPEQLRARERILDPRAVAEGALVIEGAPTAPRGPQTRAESEGSLRPMSEREAERAHRDELARMAGDRPHTRRGPPPIARPRPDGTYVYVGPRFTAVIGRDGRVEYHDAPALGTDWRGEVTFDLGDAIARGQREERMRHGLSALRGRLARIWRSELTSAAQRRERIFEEWAELEEGAGGDEARALIEQFVRENLPEGSEEAYAGAELRALNGGRAGGARFDPYRRGR